MKTVSKSQLKAKLLEFCREVEKTGEELVVLDNREPVLKIVPYRVKRTAREVFGAFRGGVRYEEDLTTPTTDEWPDV